MDIKDSSRNVEIKARVRNLESLVKKAEYLSASSGEIIKQKDVFYTVKQGRLKLRRFEDNKGELIFYDRPNDFGPRLSEYIKSDISPHSINSLNDVLTASLGVSGIVVKTRKLFMIGQTRVHIDDVDGLGMFVELEVILNSKQSLEYGQMVAKELMDQLGIAEADLLNNAYTDMLHKQLSTGSTSSASPNIPIIEIDTEEL